MGMLDELFAKGAITKDGVAWDAVMKPAGQAAQGGLPVAPQGSTRQPLPKQQPPPSATPQKQRYSMFEGQQDEPVRYSLFDGVMRYAAEKKDGEERWVTLGGSAKEGKGSQTHGEEGFDDAVPFQWPGAPIRYSLFAGQPVRSAAPLLEGRVQRYASLIRYEAEYHGPTPPAEGWSQVGEGPRGGKIWRKTGDSGKASATQSATEAKESAKPAKPKAIRAEMHGAQRVGKGKEARIVMADGSPAPAHIKPSMVPPDWTDVKVSTDPEAEVLVTARDNKGRTKTVYSDSYSMKTAALKFSRIHDLLSQRQAIYDQNQENRKDPALRENADCMWLIQEQATRPGSDKDTGGKVKAYGATTLRAEHVVVGDDGSVRLRFIGKEGVAHDHPIRNPALAEMLKERKTAAEEKDGRLFATNDGKLQAYTRSLDGGDFTPKDFRTAKGTGMAIALINAVKQKPNNDKEYKALAKEIATKVSRVLGNRPQQAIESYISPEVWSALKPTG